MISLAQRDLIDFLKTEANAAMSRACRGNLRVANTNIAEAQELLALRARLLSRLTPAMNDAQLELPFLKQAA